VATPTADIVIIFEVIGKVPVTVAAELEIESTDSIENAFCELELGVEVAILATTSNCTVSPAFTTKLMFPKSTVLFVSIVLSFVKATLLTLK